MLSCLIIAGSVYLSGPFEAVRLDEVQRMELADRTLHVLGQDLRETFAVTSYEADLRPAQIVADCATRAALDAEQDRIAQENAALKSARAPNPRFIIVPKSEIEVHTPTLREAECEEEHFRYGARDVDTVREICAGAGDPEQPDDE